MRRLLPVIGALACALPASAAAAPRASDDEVAVGPLRATAAAAAHAGHAHAAWTSRVIRLRRPVQVLGLKWRRAPRGLHAEVRVREPGERWRRWTEVSTADNGRVRGSDPVWAGGATRLQVRLSSRVRGLRVHTVRVTGARRRTAPRARAAQTGPPPIITRAQWGGDTQCRPRDTPTLGRVQMAFVHHTVNANTYGPEDSAAMVLGICRFHRNSNGWDDIGYNFLVDKYGQVFEGRAGGIDQPVVGAQAQGWNSESTGVANLGTYSSVPQTDQALGAMGQLLAWKLPLHGAPVSGTVTVRSAGGSSNRHPAGRHVTFERISGHRDGNATDCPGAQLYAQLPRIRELASSQAPAVIGAPAEPAPGSQLTLESARLALAYPEPATLTGTLLDANAQPLGGVTVRIQVLTARGFKAVTSALTDAGGRYAATLSSSRNRTVRALVGRVASKPLKLRVAPALRVRPPFRRVLAGRRAVLRGVMRPKRGSAVVIAARQVGRTTRYRRAARVKVGARNGRFRAAVRLVTPGVYRLRVRVGGDRLNSRAQVDYHVRAVRDPSAVTEDRAGR